MTSGPRWAHGMGSLTPGMLSACIGAVARHDHRAAITAATQTALVVTSSLFPADPPVEHCVQLRGCGSERLRKLVSCNALFDGARVLTTFVPHVVKGSARTL
jgi:hypothetical protein